MPAREINPFTALTRIRSQFLRTQWSTSNHSEWTRLRIRPLSHRGWQIDIGERIAGKQDWPGPIIYGPPRALRIAKNAHFYIVAHIWKTGGYCFPLLYICLLCDEVLWCVPMAQFNPCAPLHNLWKPFQSSHHQWKSPVHHQWTGYFVSASVFTGCAHEQTNMAAGRKDLIWFYWMFYDHFSARSLLAKLGRGKERRRDFAWYEICKKWLQSNVWVNINKDNEIMNELINREIVFRAKFKAMYANSSEVCPFLVLSLTVYIYCELGLRNSLFFVMSEMNYLWIGNVGFCMCGRLRDRLYRWAIIGNNTIITHFHEWKSTDQRRKLFNGNGKYLLFLFLFCTRLIERKHRTDAI